MHCNSIHRLISNRFSFRLLHRPTGHLLCTPVPSSSRPSGHQSMSSDDHPSEIKLKPLRQALSLVNESTKWIVSSIAALFLVFKHDSSVMWALLGSIVSSFLNKALKKAINQARPDNARKADPGMPSSHAHSLAFLGTYSSLALAQYHSNEAALALLFTSIFLTWLRVVLGYHTYPQVIVGFGLGSATAIGWRMFGSKSALPFLDAEPAYGKALQITTYAFGLLFAARNLLPWLKEKLRESGPKLKLA
jgi:dolichyldiphosphatase